MPVESAAASAKDSYVQKVDASDARRESAKNSDIAAREDVSKGEKADRRQREQVAAERRGGVVVDARPGRFRGNPRIKSQSEFLSFNPLKAVIRLDDKGVLDHWSRDRQKCTSRGFAYWDQSRSMFHRRYQRSRQFPGLAEA